MDKTLPYLEKILESFPEASYITDLSHRIVYWNHEAEKLTGWKSDEVIGKGCRDGILNHYDGMGNTICDSSLCALNRVITTGKPLEQEILLFSKNKAGKELLLEIKAFPLFSSDRKLIGVVEIFREVDKARKEDIVLSQRLIKNVMPTGDRVYGNLKIFSKYIPHSFVGGDFFNFMETAKGLYISFGDSEGEGVSAALISLLLSGITFINTQDLLDKDLSEAMTKIHSDFCSITRSTLTATLILGFFDFQNYSLTFSNAGHPEIFHYDSQEKKSHLIPFDSHFLGILDSSSFEQKVVNTFPGDVLLFYTDGAFEFKTGSTQRYGQEELFKVFSQAVEQGHRGESLTDSILDKLISSNKENLFDDDVTLMTIEVT